MKRKTNPANWKAIERARKSLNGIDFDEVWARTLDAIQPKIEANTLVRSRSLRKATSHAVLAA